MTTSSLFTLISRRLTFTLIFLLCVIGLSYALYAQYFKAAEACPLCIAQRVFYALIALIAGIACLHNPKRWGNFLYAIAIAAVTAFAIKIAYHHVWLQSLPPSEWPGSCGMPLEVLYKRIPLTGFLKVVLTGTAECASVEWRILGISGPLVSLWGYILIALGSVYVMLHSLFANSRSDA